MSGHDDFAFDALPGLPEKPPQGELILWQGRPDAWALARDAYKIRWFAAYFALVVLWRAGAAFADGGLSLALAIGLPYLALGLLGLGVIYFLAWVQARSTTYTLTTARVVLRVGAALPVTFNLPFASGRTCAPATGRRPSPPCARSPMPPASPAWSPTRLRRG
jgi:hypothetical protein